MTFLTALRHIPNRCTLVMLIGRIAGVLVYVITSGAEIWKLRSPVWMQRGGLALLLWIATCARMGPL
jgi:hypothetical protein